MKSIECLYINHFIIQFKAFDSVNIELFMEKYAWYWTQLNSYDIGVSIRNVMNMNSIFYLLKY